jgi:hypothetical protein
MTHAEYLAAAREQARAVHAAQDGRPRHHDIRDGLIAAAAVYAAGQQYHRTCYAGRRQASERTRNILITLAVLVVLLFVFVAAG